jgi:hypothetical protein
MMNVTAENLNHFAGQLVYILCAITSIGCTWLLIARYRKTRIPLLFWSAAAFFAFTLTNILLYLDRVIVPDIDFSIHRNFITFVGALVLLYGLIRSDT